MLALLFGADGSDQASDDRWAARYAAVAVAIAAVIVVRRPDAILDAQFWAEDGKVFFWEQLTLGFWRALGHYYAGFPYLTHRLVGALAAVTPIAWVPLVFNVTAIAITALTMATFSLPGFRHLIRSDGLRAAVCVATVCMPASNGLLATPTNLGWFVAIWLVLLSVMRTPRTVAGIAAWSLGGVIAVCSTPLAPVAAPLWALRAWHAGMHRRADLGFALVQSATLVAVLGSTRALGAGFSTAPGAGTVGGWQAGHLWSALGELWRVMAACLDAALLPLSVVQRLEALGPVALALPSLLAVVLVAFAARDLCPRARVTLCLAIYLFAASLYLVLAGRPSTIQLLRGEIPNLELPTLAIIGSRHRALPNFAVLMAVAALADGARRVRARVVAAAACAALVVAWAPELRVPRLRDLDWPTWAARLEHRLASGGRDQLVIPSDPPGYEIVVGGPPRE